MNSCKLNLLVLLVLISASTYASQSTDNKKLDLTYQHPVDFDETNSITYEVTAKQDQKYYGLDDQQPLNLPEHNPNDKFQNSTLKTKKLPTIEQSLEDVVNKKNHF
jgi:hypothetical protein